MSTPYLPPNLPPNRRIMPPTPRKLRWPDLAIDQILGWADAHHAREGVWPTADSGVVLEAPREKWSNINAALRVGLRGLEPGSSLARLLQRARGVRNRKDLPKFTQAQILEWADAHHGRTGDWPLDESGPVVESPEDTWNAVAVALIKGLRGLPGGTSLPQLLAAHRQVRNQHDLPPLAAAPILEWADAHHRRTGRWPTSECGPIAEAPGETWCAINQALKKGARGLPGGSTLARLLEAQRGVPNRLNQPDLTETQILTWADDHHQRTGRWPVISSGPIVNAPGETWARVHHALRQGRRGLPHGGSLARLLAEHRSARRQGKVVRVILPAQILAWADAHHARTGRWPTGNSGPVVEAPGETWNAIDLALARGQRGLPGGASLPRLLAEQRGVVSKHGRLAIGIAQILAWADAHHARTGEWPRAGSGPVVGAAGETWRDVDRALARGLRGLPGGSSLARLLAAQRGMVNEKNRPPLSVEQVLGWADAYHARARQWPTKTAGAIPEASGESWSSINNSLIQGNRGLPKGSSLPRLLDEHRGVPNRKNRPPLTVEQILAWADAHFGRHARWPRIHGDAVDAAPDESWSGIESALQQGTRGLPGGTTLYRLLAEHRGVQDWRSRRR